MDYANKKTKKAQARAAAEEEEELDFAIGTDTPSTAGKGKKGDAVPLITSVADAKVGLQTHYC